MYRLGVRLTLRSGREPFVRLLVTGVAVAIGVAIMLAVLADFHAFQVTNNRPSWESTTGQAVGNGYASAPRSELWNYSDDIYRGHTVERLAIAFVLPPLLLRGPASRRAAARREERYAARRLVGETSRQSSVISWVAAVVSALLGAVLGIGIFPLLPTPLADSAITSARYFYNEVTPTAAGYLAVLVAVPAASAISSLLSQRRGRVFPLRVSRRVATPPATPS